MDPPPGFSKLCASIVYLKGSFVEQFDVAVVQSDPDDVSERIVAQAQVFGVLVLVLDLII
jgi:hypothetical protein